MEKPCRKGAGRTLEDAWEEEKRNGLGTGSSPWGRARRGEPERSFSTPFWGTPGPAHCPGRGDSPASQNSSQRKANSSAVRCITRKKGVLVLGAEWLPAKFGIKVEQRIPGGERGLSGEETGSSEQQRGQGGHSLTEGHAPQGQGSRLLSRARTAPSAVPTPRHLPSVPRMGRTHSGEAALTHG